jgi:hypothetical protein
MEIKPYNYYTVDELKQIARKLKNINELSVEINRHLTANNPAAVLFDIKQLEGNLEILKATLYH